MKWFLISLAIGLASSDKLDRTYLPPPGAQFAGGVLGSHDAPLKPPHLIHSGPETAGRHEDLQPTIGVNREPANFGDKIPKVPANHYTEKVPTTTTSYAFSQTTTYPPGETFEATALPINPVTGLPAQQGQGNHPYGTSQGQLNIQNLPGYTQNLAPTYETNILPGFTPGGPSSAPINFGNPSSDQYANQYPGQNVITPDSAGQTPGLVNQIPGQNHGQGQYSDGLVSTEQQGFQPTGASNNQRIDQYSGQNVVNPGGIVQTPDGNQGLVQYPGSQPIIAGQQGFTPSTASSTSIQLGGNQNGMNYDGSQGPQGTYTGPPINVQNLREGQNQEPLNIGGISSQYPTGNQNYVTSGPRGSENVNQPGSTASTIPSSYYNDVSGATPVPGIPSSTSAYSSSVPVFRPERPQAASDRNAVILNYQNVRTPNGYSYSFDTSNGIHADESGIVDNGTKAQGSYSYTGDDGKVYTVFYTADENGFQPRGDHLPTPPPIPEAIKRVIEQAARDKAAGIVDDGSYDENKYGDKKYQGVSNRRRPQNQGADGVGNKQLNVVDDRIKPIVGIKDKEYDETIPHNQFDNNFLTSMRKSSGNLPSKRPSNQILINRENNIQDVSEGNRRVSENGNTQERDFYENDVPVEDEGISQLSNYGTEKQGTIENNLMSNGNKQNKPSKKYPGSNVDVGSGDYSISGRDGFVDNKHPDIGSGKPNTPSNGLNQNTGTPSIGNRKQTAKQRIKDNQRPDSIRNEYSQTERNSPQDGTFSQKITATPSINDNLKKNANQPISNELVTQENDSGYQYQQPNTKFEQNTFPTRFSPPEVTYTMKPDQRRTDYSEGTTRKPFITPNVYNQNDRTSQSSGTRRPFTTVGVTRPADNSYTDYEDGDDYDTDQDTNPSRDPTVKSITSGPYQSTEPTSTPQYSPDGHKLRANQKGTVTPGYKTEHSETVSPGYFYGSTKPTPSHNSRFGSTETPQKMKPDLRRPSSTIPDSTTAVGSPVTSQYSTGTTPSDYKYQTTGPNSKYPGSNVGSGYPTTGSTTIGTTPGVSTPQNYYTSTCKPYQVPSSTTPVPPTSGYTHGFGSQTPSRTPGLIQPSQDESFHTGYHYGPPKFTGLINPDQFNSDFFTPTGNSGLSPTLPTGTYQTTYQEGQGGFPSTTLVPSLPGTQTTFIPSDPGRIAPESSPIGTYQGHYQKGPSTPDYSTTKVSSTPDNRPVFGYPGAPGLQETTGYEYGPSRPNYSITGSPSTVGTTSGSYKPSDTIVPSQGYTTYRPGFQTTKDTFVGGPVVDGFGRPITIDQGGSHPGFVHPTQGSTEPSIGPNFGGTEKSAIHSGAYDQPRVIGEDFSGPKQPQRYDPKTGYHYK